MMGTYRIKLQEPFQSIIKLDTLYCNNNSDVSLNISLPDKSAILAIQLLLRNVEKFTAFEEEIYAWFNDHDDNNMFIKIILTSEEDYQVITRFMHLIFGNDAYQVLIDINSMIDHAIVNRLVRQDLIPSSKKELFLAPRLMESLKHQTQSQDIHNVDHSNDRQTIIGLLLFSGFSYEDSYCTAIEEELSHHSLIYISGIEHEIDNYDENNNILNKTKTFH